LSPIKVYISIYKIFKQAYKQLNILMNIAILGTTAGTHFLAQKFAKSGHTVHFLNNHPKVPTIQNLKKYLFTEIDSISLAKKILLKNINSLNNNQIDLIIPTQLSYQLWSDFQHSVINTHIPALLPSKDLAQYEWSKTQSKMLFESLGIDTPSYEVFTFDNLIKNFSKIPKPFVLKFNEDYRLGLQTLIITDQNYNEMRDYITSYGNIRWQSGVSDFVNQTFVVEEYIDIKREYSYHALCGRQNWKYLGSARDYKKRHENDVGHNTAGMGSYAPVKINPIVHEYQERIFNFLKENGTPMIGILYLGVAETADGRTVLLEVNTRPGDPELQSTFSLIDTDLAHLFHEAASGKKISDISFNSKSAVTVRIVRSDYNIHRKPQPTKYPILKNVPKEITVSFNSHFGLLHSTLTAVDDTIDLARLKIYNYLLSVDLGNYIVRYDIGNFL
jgi:phosphoribosylamine---glycine ligase